MQQIAKGLRISAEALYVQAGILDERVVGGVVIDAIIADPTITERQKQVMVEVYDSFRKENLRRDADEAALARGSAESVGTAESVGSTEASEVSTATVSKSDGPHRVTTPPSTHTVTAKVTPLRTTMSRSTSPRKPR
jgi:hypothetical protein